MLIGARNSLWLLDCLMQRMARDIAGHVMQETSAGLLVC